MSMILIAGGTGALGRALQQALIEREEHVRVMSRQPAPADLDPRLEWAVADLTSGAGLPEALAGVTAVINASGDPRNAFAVEVQGTVRLIEAARSAGASHFFQVSIVGIDRIGYPYYEIKQSVEAAVESSGLPWTIQRLPQFFTLMQLMLSRGQFSEAGYVLPLAADARFQPIDVADAAGELAPLLLAGPSRRLPDVGGPEVLSMEQIARAWLDVQGQPDLALIDPEEGFFPEEALAGFRRGYALAPQRPRGRRRWVDYVKSL